jgi:TRAP-type C4-dicarboxylate transport system permease small subunit
LNRVWHYFERLDETASGVALGVMTVVVAAGFVLRYALGQPLYWSNEFAGILFVWSVFLGASAGIRSNSHLGVDVFVGLAPPRVRLWLEMVANLAVAAALIALIVLGSQLTETSIKKTIALEVPYWVINVAIPVGSSMMLIHLAVRTARRVRWLRMVSHEPPTGPTTTTTRRED